MVVWCGVHWPLAGTQAIVPPTAPGGDAPGLAGGPLPHVAMALGLGVGAVAPGVGLLSLVGLAGASPLERLAYALPLGLGALATALSVLALIGLLSPGPMALVTLLVLTAAPVVGPRAQILEAYVALARLPAAAVRRAAEAGPAAAIGIGAFAAMAAVALVKASTPPWYPDALLYHLALPRTYLEASGFVPVPGEPINSGHPGLVQLLFATALAWGRDDVAAVLCWLHLPAMALACALLARDVAGPRVALLAVAGLASVPHLSWMAGVPLADMPLLAHLTLALHATVRASTGASEGAGWVMVGALCLGMALATKYQAIVSILPLLSLLAFAAGRSRFAARAGAAAAALVAPFLPWAIRNAMTHGSPLFPLHVPSTTSDPVVDLLGLFREDWVTHGHGASLGWLPFDVTFLARTDTLAAYEGQVGPLALALAPLPFLLGLPGPTGSVSTGPSRPGHRQRTPWAPWAIGAYALLLLTVWSAGAREVRYLLPAIPPLLVFALSPLGCPAAARGARSTRGLEAVVALGALGGLALFVGESRPGADLPYLLGREGRQAYYSSLGATAGLYRACEALRSMEPQRTVMLLWEDRGYLFAGRYLADHLVPGSSAHVLHRLPLDARAAHRRLIELGVSHVVLNGTAWEEARRAGVTWAWRGTFEALMRARSLRPVWTERPAILGGFSIWHVEGGD